MTQFDTGKKPVKKILFATDLSEMCNAPFSVALNTAKKSNCELYVVHVLESADLGRHRQFVQDIWTGEGHWATSEYVAKVKELIRDMYVPKMNGFARYSIEVRPGFPYTEILRTASRANVDLIVMAPHTGMAETKGVSRTCGRVTSTLQGVTTGARCPVMVVPNISLKGDKVERILMATDFSKCSDYAFDCAYAMATQLDAKLFIFTVRESVSDALLPSLPGSDISGHREPVSERVTERYGARLKDFEDYAIEVSDGVPHVEILKFSRTRDVQLIVMGAHAREEDLAWYPDDTVDTLAQVSMRSPCPVISACAGSASDRIWGFPDLSNPMS